MQIITTSRPSAFGPGVYTIYGKDGKVYPTQEAARAADNAYNQMVGSSGGAGRSSKGFVSKSSTGAGAGNMTSEFLKKWGQINDQVLSSLNSAIGDLNNGASYPGSEQLQSLISQIGDQSKQYGEMYGGFEQASLDQATTDLKNRGKLADQYMELATPDYEGVAGRAAGDVRAASERALGAEQREGMSYGVDPSSGKFGSLTKKGYLDMAKNEVIAANTARRGEKERVAGMTATGMQLIDPSKTYSLANDIAQQKANFTNQQANLQLADTNAGMNAINAKTNIINNIADIGSQYGSAGMTMLGINEARAGEGAGGGTTGSAYESIYGGGTTVQPGGSTGTFRKSLSSNPSSKTPVDTTKMGNNNSFKANPSLNYSSDPSLNRGYSIGA